MSLIKEDPGLARTTVTTLKIMTSKVMYSNSKKKSSGN